MNNHQTDKEVENEILKEMLQEIQKYDKQKYHTIQLTITKNNTKNIRLPPLNSIEKYNNDDIEEEYIKGNEQKYKLLNLYKFFTHAHSKNPEDQNLNTIINYLKQLEYTITLINEAEQNKNKTTPYLENALKNLHTEIQNITNKYDNILKHTQNNKTTDTYIEETE